MARGKKKEKLTLEEKLEQALVPVEEQPYEVPGNWCWTTIESISDVVSKGTTPKGGKSSYIEDGISFLRVENFLDDGTISHEGMMHIAEDIHFGILKRSILEKDDVLISIAGTLGKTAIVQEDNLPINTNQAVAFIRINSKVKILPKYLRFSLINPVIQNYLLKKTKVTSIPNLTLKIISSCPIPLPPKEEQQLIVGRIESLFAKLNEAKEKAQDILDTFEDRKASILYKAFQGMLTRVWRENHMVKSAEDYLQDIIDKREYFSKKEIKFWKNDNLPISWAESKIGNLLYFAGRIGWKGLKAEEYTEEGPMLLSVYNLNDGDEVSYNRVYHITKERYEESPEIMVEQGDVLLTKDGAGIGKLEYVKELPQEATINSSLLLIRPGNVAISKYIFYLLSGPELQRIVKERITGSATPHLFQRDIKEFIIPVPPIEEQEEIVRILDDVLSKETAIYEVTKNTIDWIDIMKKSILAKAFRGELGTNNPEEESAIELLKTILVET